VSWKQKWPEAVGEAEGGKERPTRRVG